MSPEFLFLFPTLRFFYSFNRDSLFPPSGEEAPVNTDFGGHRFGKKENGSLASAVAHAAKRRQATTAVPLSAPLCWDGHPSFCTYAKLLLAAVIIGISRSARSRSRDE